MIILISYCQFIIQHLKINFKQLLSNDTINHYFQFKFRVINIVTLYNKDIMFNVLNDKIIIIVNRILTSIAFTSVILKAEKVIKENHK